MRLVVMVMLLATACGKGGEGWECTADADCNTGLRCALLETGDGARRTMCVNPTGAWNTSEAPKSYRREYGLPVGAGVAGLVVLLMLRASVRARLKRRRARSES